jgi:hypothetical protein
MSIEITLLVEPRADGGLRIRGKDMPEIHVVGPNVDWAFEDLGGVLQVALVKAGHSWAKPRCEDRAAWLNSAPVGREA